MTDLNREIRHHILTNWGRFLRATGRGSARRRFLAGLVRQIRADGRQSGTCGALELAVYAPACAWASALIQD